MAPARDLGDVGTRSSIERGAGGTGRGILKKERSARVDQPMAEVGGIGHPGSGVGALRETGKPRDLGGEGHALRHRGEAGARLDRQDRHTFNDREM